MNLRELLRAQCATPRTAQPPVKEWSPSDFATTSEDAWEMAAAELEEDERDA
jgi:hypothetical protein